MSIDLVLLLAICLGVPTLIKLNILSVEHRLIFLFGAFLAMAIWGFSTLTPGAMGFSNRYFIKGIVPWGEATLFMLAGIVMAAVLLRHQHAEDPFKDPHFLFLFVPISIVQQFIYQSVLLQKLLQEFDPRYAIVICALCFGYMHTIFPRQWRNLMLATAGGVFFSLLFYLYPNFLLAALSHMVLNFVAVYLGFFTLLTPEGKPRATRLRPASLRRSTAGIH
jgi:membrane protease YdiL (CAAX protease family)